MTCDHVVRRCRLCGTFFEENVADRSADGEVRCPQCGLSESEIAQPAPDAFVVRESTKFR